MHQIDIYSYIRKIDCNIIFVGSNFEKVFFPIVITLHSLARWFYTTSKVECLARYSKIKHVHQGLALREEMEYYSTASDDGARSSTKECYQNTMLAYKILVI